jgi:hypothetical protein
MEKKRNVVIDGEFVKIGYSDQLLEMNELCILCEIKAPDECAEDDGFILKRKSSQKNVNLNCYDNLGLINALGTLEYEILNRYTQQKTPVYNLKTQLLNGKIKITQGNLKLIRGDGRQCCVVKISGLWETSDSVGLTFKFIGGF